jgi:hypothetical protein
LFTLSRGSSTAYDRYQNATSLGAASIASASVGTGSLVFGRDNSSFSMLQFAAGGAGGFLTGTDVTALYNALYAYLHDSTVGAV